MSGKEGKQAVVKRAQLISVLCQYIAPCGKHLQWHAIKLLIAERLSVKPAAVSHLWLKYKMSILYPEKYGVDISRKNGLGHPCKIELGKLYELVKAVPFSQRRMIRALAPRVELSITALHVAMHKGLLSRRTSAIKPHLMQENMQRRLSYCLSFVDANDKFFSDMMDRVDIDEKWFYIATINASNIIVPSEEPPTRRCKHKQHLIKIMCLTAFAHPRENPDNPGKFWDGKIGQWFLVEEYLAQHTTNNRPAELNYLDQ